MTAAQTLVIENWLPEPIANGSHGHHMVKHRKLQDAQKHAQDHAFAARWKKIDVKARLTIVLVFPTNQRRDTDNLYSRCKGVIDGLKPWIVDDSMQWLELHVTARVEPRRKAVELRLEAAA